MSETSSNSDVRAQAQPAAGARYNAPAQALHWITAALIFITLALAWVMTNMPDDAPTRGLLFTLHKSFGITIFALVIVRIVWRGRHPAPPLAARLSRWDRSASVASHMLLYLLLIVMPISGYMMSAAGAHPISFFGLFNLPISATKDEAAEHAAFFVHVGVLQWVLYALVLLHVGAALWHVIMRRDGVLDRMLPPQGEEHGRHPMPAKVDMGWRRPLSVTPRTDTQPHEPSE
ncbi:cytochrome b561 [Rhodoblastus acidophilus]|uniref:cytochrome b n=1 Tax=Rhodoblastus acidophilus TaxID=1074 RepID=UPI001616E85F|nr:cytochrome b [Rhodoblastus acidophilus]MCW2283971.1 cytochrome b561 [Rhodoblastus acidophilus]MCW2332667.1 cytochrome b561 [Rhodoblastus acidophilus]